MTKVIGIFICPEKGQPMREVEGVKVLAGVGLEGDRYDAGTGTYTGFPNITDRSKCIRQVTIISRAALDEANKSLPSPFSPIETRRNILVDHADLLSLIGKEFTIGNVRMRGFEDCAPCKIPGRMANKIGFEEAFAKRGGLRAEILSDGTIRIGDELVS